MGRPKGIKNKVEAVELQEKEQVVTEAQTEQAQTEVKAKAKKEEFVLIKTSNKDVVVKANELKFQVVHISGYGTVNNPKVFFMNVLESKLREKLTEEEIKDVDGADLSEIGNLVKLSREKGNREQQESNAHKRKLNQEIPISQVY
jgi:hypothetical protein